MWICPKCGRTFKKTNQSHYCGTAPKTIDEYISSQLVEKQQVLQQVRETIRSAIPEAKECISWSMPTYYEDTNILHFAANKNHIGLYVGEEAVDEFSERLSEYKTSKGTIHIPYDVNSMELIAAIAQWCYMNRNEK